MSATGSRRVRKTVPGRRETWVTWPSTQTRPSLSIHSASDLATVRTGSGDSALLARPTRESLGGLGVRLGRAAQAAEGDGRVARTRVGGLRRHLGAPGRAGL